MKRVFTIVLMIALCISASAQKWTIENFEEDELTGTAPYTAHNYSYPNIGEFIVWEWNKPSFQLITDKGMFREDIYNTGFGNFRADKVYVGVYRVSTKQLVEKYILYMNIEDNSMYKYLYINSYNATLGGIKKVKKILKALQTKDTAVRFVCKRYNMDDFDLVVPCYTGK